MSFITNMPLPNPSLITIATCPLKTLRMTGSSRIFSRSGWRGIATNGARCAPTAFPKKFCTGLATPFEKFRAWASTVPHTLRNPLYHWTHLELKRCFGIEELLDEASAARIWNKANEQLASPRMTTHGILKKFKVRALCTTDDPADDLAHHEAIGDSGLATRVLPTFRPDKALALGDAVEFNKWITRLEATANRDISNLESFMTVLRQRHDQFHAIGCRLSDHGLAYCYATLTSAKAAAAIFSKARHGRPVSPEDQASLAPS